MDDIIDTGGQSLDGTSDPGGDLATGGNVSSDPFAASNDGSFDPSFGSPQNTGTLFPGNADNSGSGLGGMLSGALRSLFGASMTQPGGTLNNLGLTDQLGNLTTMGEVALIGGALLVVMLVSRG